MFKSCANDQVNLIESQQTRYNIIEMVRPSKNMQEGLMLDVTRSFLIRNHATENNEIASLIFPEYGSVLAFY